MAHPACARVLAATPGLAEALKFDHYITKDVKERFERFGSLSPKQIALVLKLATEKKDESPKVAAPEGRFNVVGRVLSVKEYEGDYGVTFKMTVKVEREEGHWLAWGTVPTSLLHGSGEDFKPGAEVTFTATFKRGRDEFFALFSRPAKASVVLREAKTEVDPVEVAERAAIEREEHAKAVAEDDDGTKADKAREAGKSFLDWVA